MRRFQYCLNFCICIFFVLQITNFLENLPIQNILISVIYKSWDTFSSKILEYLKICSYSVQARNPSSFWKPNCGWKITKILFCFLLCFGLVLADHCLLKFCKKLVSSFFWVFGNRKWKQKSNTLLTAFSALSGMDIICSLSDFRLPFLASKAFKTAHA